MKNTHILIMAGGIGSRFWPYSRNYKPKQFLDILGTGRTLIQQTYDRLIPICNPSNIWIVTNESYKNLVKSQLPDITDEQILYEPIGKNTAPCIAYGCYKIYAKHKNSNIIIVPADHIILKENVFHSILERALKYVDDNNNNNLVTLGMMPTRPDTGYGYIEYGNEEIKGINYVKTFTEKPNRELAEEFINSGNYLWNSGMFIWNLDTIIESFKTHALSLHELFMSGMNLYYTNDEREFIKNIYDKCPSISIDYAIMEKANNVRIIPASFGWSDVGTWSSVYELKNHDENENALSSDNIILNNCTNNIVETPKDKLVIIEGLDDYIVVDANDALLICRKINEQKIKQYIQNIDMKFK